jgi:hypothetical protein
MRYCERMRARYFPESLRTLPPLFEGEAASTDDGATDARESPVTSPKVVVARGAA